MTKYGQRDPRWKDKKIGKSSSSIGSYGCTITCLSMLADITPDEFNTRLTAVNGYQVDLVIWSKIKEAIPKLEFEWRGYQYDNDKVKQAIADYGACLVEVDFDGSIATPRDRHWVLYIGNGRMYDPWTGGECATSKYPIATGYAIIKVYNKPENMDPILQFIKDNNITEGQLREGFAYVKEQTVPKLEKKVEDLESLQNDLKARLDKLEAKVKESEANEQNWQKELSTAKKTISKLTKDLEFYEPYKTRYEAKCKESVNTVSSGVLFKKLLINLGLWPKEK